MSGLAAADLLRGTGLLVDGPVRWGSQVSGREAGIFIVELSTPRDEAPIDEDALSRWLDNVPGLTLDGERPTPRELARRLAEFWLPGEPIVYVGRARRAVSARIAALYQTPLGDNKPNASGHWLKTLATLPQARIWWATTEAHEEYEDDLMARFKSAVADSRAAERSMGLPFANLSASDGTSKPHGIANSLREPAAIDSTAAKPAPGTPRRAAARRPAAARTGATTRSRATAASKAGPPAVAPSMVSASGARDLHVELDELRNKVRPAVIDRVKTARELGDLRENAEYQEARREQSFVEGRIQAIEALLRNAIVVEAGTDGVVAVGSTVVVDLDGDEITWQLVGSNEADPANGRISYVSPVGQALMGRRAGDQVTARLPRGDQQLRLREVR